ncbi:MAG: hypothetical protein V1873_07315 [Verrucomicrobiota bacterium]
MKSRMATLLVCVAAALMLGCEGDWTSGGGVESWNDSYNWVNFSGVYRGIGGGVLVTDFSATPGTPGVTNSVDEEVIATGNGANTYFEGTLNHAPVVLGSVQIDVQGVGTFTDNGTANLDGPAGTVGTIDHGTGGWSIDCGPIAPEDGAELTANYLYAISGSSGDSGADPGSSGVTIYSFTVHQEGNRIAIVDNNGKSYEGNFGSIRTSGGAQSGDTPAAGDSVIGQYSASGVSAAGYSVRMVGTFQGVVTTGGNNFYLSDRKMYGTWIEEGGTEGDINGESSPIPISVGDGGGGEAAPAAEPAAI